MARLWTEGFEFGDALFFTYNGSVSSAQAHTGTYSAQTSYSSPAWLDQVPYLTEFYYRMWYRVAGLGATDIFKWGAGTYGSPVDLGALAHNGKVFTLKVGSNVVATGDIEVQANKWYLLEVHLKYADTGGELELKVNGDLDASFYGDTRPGFEPDINHFTWNRSSSDQAWFDDLALNDTTGAVDNNWCADGRVILLTPDDNGDVSQLSGSDGDSVNNYLLVDEIPADNDTTYVQEDSGGGGDRDLYNLEACGLSDVTIRRVWVETRARITAVGPGGDLALIVKTHATEYASGGVLLEQTYDRYIGDDHATNPNTAAAWTTAELDALQVGPQGNSAAFVERVTNIGANVEYVDLITEKVHLTQEIAEAGFEYTPPPEIRLTQEVVEPGHIPSIHRVYVTQMIVEVGWIPPKGDYAFWW
jgi:hypothetical protein